MKESIFIKNIKQLNTVGELKKLLENYTNETEIVADTENATTELYVGITNPVGDRDVEEQEILIFGGNRTE
ncbi:hypothetical protein NYZ99_04865 [Maribacter litopenaei]|uniref:Uncharacterized protein n=1 Tax=Maribacter litopenaei TaxID=2976127 RepID=A0ABY5YBR9_9FLAO|nr:hypothetical protein [Maribacter litopenaei]UWX55757.1 hypothetical protein NYZ99_04865 [Maribacter litopenaei]